MGEGYREKFHRGSEDSCVVGDDKFVQGVLAGLDKRVSGVPRLDRMSRGCVKLMD